MLKVPFMLLKPGPFLAHLAVRRCEVAFLPDVVPIPAIPGHRGHL